MSIPVLTFDIETVPCLDTARAMYPQLAPIQEDSECLLALQAIRREETDGRDFLRLPLHKIICISFVWQENGVSTIRTLKGDDEHHILSTFIRAFIKKPTLVGWNTQGFDLPVLLYRMARHNINAELLMGAGNKNLDYTHKFCDRHVDLMDKFSFGAWGNRQSLHTIASLLGYAGKGDTKATDVLDLYKIQDWQAIENYCERDVINTHLIYLRWLQLSGVQNIPYQIGEFLAKTKSLQNNDGTLKHPDFF